MANPSSDFPTKPHEPTDLSGFGQTHLGFTAPKHTEVEGKQEEELVALGEKLGAGPSTPLPGQVLIGAANGKSAWGQASSIISPFVKSQNGMFILKGQELKFVGINHFELIRDAGNRSTATQFLDSCKRQGINVVRTYLDPAANIRSLFYPVGTNLLTNGDFETDPAVEWTFPANFTWSTEKAYNGTHSLKLVGNSGDFPTASRQITVTPNKIYHLTYRYQLTNVSDGNPTHFTPSFSIGTGTGGGAALDRAFEQYIPATTPSVGWVEKQITFTAGPSDTTLYINLISWGGINTGFWDNLILSEDTGAAPTLVYNPLVLEVVDFVMDEARKRGIKLMLSLVDGSTNNTMNLNWYLTKANAIYGTSYGTSFPFLDFFTSNFIKAMYKDYFSTIVNRRNTINGLLYKDDPTVFSWEEGNELAYENPVDAGINTIASTNLAVLSKPGGWADEMSTYFKTQDPNHMVNFGDMGHSHIYSAIGADQDVVFNGTRKGVSYQIMAALPNIDFVDFHIYPNQGNGSGFGYKVSPSDIRGWGYGLGFTFIAHLNPSAAGWRGQLNDYGSVAQANGKPAVCTEVGLEAGFTPAGDLPLYNRYIFFKGFFEDTLDLPNGIKGVIPWSGASGTSNGGFFAIALDSFGGELLTDNSNDTTLVNLIKKYNDKFQLDILASQGELSPLYQPLGVIQQIAATGTISIDPTKGFIQQTPTGDSTFNASFVGKFGTELIFKITTTGTTSRTLTFGAGFKPAGTLATGTTSGKTFIVKFISDGSSYLETSRTAAL